MRRWNILCRGPNWNSGKAQHQNNNTSTITTSAERGLVSPLDKALSSGLASKSPLNRNLDSRVFPSFVMDAVFMWTRLVFGVGSPDLQHFRFIEELMVEAEHLLIFRVGGDTCWRCRRHRSGLGVPNIKFPLFAFQPVLSKVLIINLWKQSQGCALIIESLWREGGFVWRGSLSNASGSARTVLFFAFLSPLPSQPTSQHPACNP